MPAYLIQHPAEQRREDILIEDPALTLTFDSGWAVFADAQGFCLAIPSGQGAHIQRVDEHQDQEPAPQKE
ncbi:hypothetical protein HW130_03040 [Streptomyces sp. PKU-EA00015]|uniref:hypothetical protein n=1 Tax=Streptomyces sp. PKU-EA00015 TaxID=2748326 RepID=UPI0015A1C17B|nr:hypothetical protein [Streptomyces sp. PKU-EA00015]NWF25247.1 hypothetical protein [Streptomyces sp. PKU-EA00015]